MSCQFIYDFEESVDLYAQIKIIGVGCGGGRILKHLIDQKTRAVEYVFVDSDPKAITESSVKTTLQLSANSPDAGSNAAASEHDDILALFRNIDMVIIVANMSDGVGERIAPVIAAAAKNQNILTTAVVIEPFMSENLKHVRLAQERTAELSKCVDSVIVASHSMLISDDHAVDENRQPVCNNVALSALTVRDIVYLITQTTYMGIDFADVKIILSKYTGESRVGFGTATGINRADVAVKRALLSMHRQKVDMYPAQGMLIMVSGNEDMTLKEYDGAISIIYNRVHDDAEIVAAMVYDQELGENIRVTVVLTGLSGFNA
ncbi:cell division protein FtsZ [Mariprofundus ferrooxydans]|nr:cell division protein FtsZ [Mariprofundus ferrooxydans]MBN4077058.1 cell division protein FtsZ [Mariprofundus ferrooxydans]